MHSGGVELTKLTNKYSGHEDNLLGHRGDEADYMLLMNPNQSVLSPLNLCRSPCVAACLAPESAIPNWSQVIQAMHVPISRIHLIGYLVEDGITSSVHAKHTFSRTSIMLRIQLYLWSYHSKRVRRPFGQSRGSCGVFFG